MIQRLWRSKTVTQQSKPQKIQLQQQSLIPCVNQNQIHLPNYIGCKIIEIEMQIEDGNLNKNLLIQLLQEYTKAVQFYEEKGDERYKMYQKKIHNFLQKQSINAVMNGKQNIGTMILKKQRAQEQIRKATTNSMYEVKKLIENSQVDAERQKNKIEKQVNRQMQSLERRLENKRSNSNNKKIEKQKNISIVKAQLLSELTDLSNQTKELRMVKLGFTLQTKGSIDKVFGYFSHFEKIAQWDLNVQSAKILKQTPNKIGSTYEVISLWKGSPSQMIYEMVAYKQNSFIQLKAKNGMIEAEDYMEFKQKQGGTLIIYNAQISLRHVLWLLTPFIKSDLQQLAVNAEKGMKAKCIELFG